MSDITTKIYSLVSRYVDIQTSTLTPNTTFVELGFDSLDAVELAMDMETEFNIEITDDQAEQMHTLGDTVEIIQQILQKKRRVA